MIAFAIDNEGSVTRNLEPSNWPVVARCGRTNTGILVRYGAWRRRRVQKGSCWLGPRTAMSGSIAVLTKAEPKRAYTSARWWRENPSVTVSGDGNGPRGGELELTGPGTSTIKDLTVSGARGYYINAGTLSGPGEVHVTGSFVGGRQAPCPGNSRWRSNLDRRAQSVSTG